MHSSFIKLAVVALVHIIVGVHCSTGTASNANAQITQVYIDLTPVPLTPQANVVGSTAPPPPGCVVIDGYIYANCSASPSQAHIFFVPSAVDVYYNNGNVANILKIESGCDSLWHPCNYSFTLDFTQAAPGARIVYRWLAPQGNVLSAVTNSSILKLLPSGTVLPATQLSLYFGACVDPSTNPTGASNCVSATNFINSVTGANISTIPSNPGMMTNPTANLNWVTQKLPCASVSLVSNLTLTANDFVIQELAAAFPFGTDASEPCPGALTYAHRGISSLHDNPPSMATFTVPYPANDQGLRATPINPTNTQCTVAGTKACVTKALTGSMFNSDKCAPVKAVSQCYVSNSCTYPLQDLCSTDRARACGVCYN